MVNFDKLCMGLALDAAWRYQGVTYPNPAVGAVVVQNRSILGIGAHKEAGLPHAEVEAIKEAYITLTNDNNIKNIQDADKLHVYLIRQASRLFRDATIYVTLEPCAHHGKTPPCSNLIAALGFKRVVVAAKECNVNASGGIELLRKAAIEVDIGVLEKEAKDLLEPFCKWQKGRFAFFKLAQTLNGVIEGGTISCEASRRFVHKLREKIDLLVIGGNTVRVDRPRLDARLVGGRAPDILILSRQKDFDPSIPLFGIPKRKVYIEDRLDRINEYRFVMVEGGEGMLEATSDIVDWYLHFIAPQNRSCKNYRFEKDIQFLHNVKIGDDLMIWSRNG